MQEPAVLFLAFNRPASTGRVFDAIRRERPKKLYIALDGPRRDRDDDAARCAAVRQIVERVDWDCDVRRLIRDANLGCGRAVRSALDWFFDHEAEGIVLEDDCLPTRTFFRYCRIMLERFRDDPRIMSINGCNFGYELPSADYGFTRFMNMWGWATWKDRLAKVDYDLSDWRTEFTRADLKRALGLSPFNNDVRWLSYWEEVFDRMQAQEIDTWDYPWVYAALKNAMWSVFPAHNLVENIGFNADATHTFDASCEMAAMQGREMATDFSKGASARPDPIHERHYVKRVWCQYLQRPYIVQRLSLALRRRPRSARLRAGQRNCTP